MIGGRFDDVDDRAETHGCFSSCARFCSSCANGSANGFFGSTTGNRFRRDGSIDGKALQEIVSESRRDFAEIRCRKLNPGFVLLFGFAQYLADEIVGLAERHAATDEIVRSVGGKKGWIGSGGTEPGFAEFCQGKGAGGNREHVMDLIVGGKEGFLVFLEVALVAGGQTLQCGEQD